MIPENGIPDSSAACGAGHFVTTHWSAVIRAGQTEGAASHEALSELCHTYWYPLYAFVRRQGHPPAEAEDLVQGFFARLLEKNYVADAQETKGKFRSFLLTSLKRFMANEWDRVHAQKRGGFKTAVEIDQAMAEKRFDSELAHELQPDVLFERQWAVTLLDRVMTQLEEEYIATGRARLFEELRSCLGKETSARPYSEIARRLNLTEPSIKTAVHRMRGRYREILRAEIGKTVSSAQEIEEELRHLFATFSS